MVIPMAEGIISILRRISVKTHLLDSSKAAARIGRGSIDASIQQEAERLQQENKMLWRSVREKESLINTAHSMAHDICSPLQALNMMVSVCHEIPENKRDLINKAKISILDIANSFLETFQRESRHIEQRQPVLIADLIVDVLNEKKVQYLYSPVTFDTNISSYAQFATARLQASQFRRAMSNLINNAVEALDNKSSNRVTIELTADYDAVSVTVHDNGRGMSASAVKKMVQRKSFTEGKQGGHGLGLLQVWNMLDQNEGTMTVCSVIGQETNVRLTFPLIK